MRQQQQQAVYYAHVADPRCTLSSSVRCCSRWHWDMHVPAAMCDWFLLLRTDHPRINMYESSTQQVVRTIIVYCSVRKKHSTGYCVSCTADR